jgi:hypothetical protein
MGPGWYLGAIGPERGVGDDAPLLARRRGLHLQRGSRLLADRDLEAARALAPLTRLKPRRRGARVVGRGVGSWSRVPARGGGGDRGAGK